MTMPRLKFVASIIAGQSPSSTDVRLYNGGTPFLQGKAEFGPVNPFPKYECAVAPRYCEAGDMLVSVRAPVGAINLADQRYGIGRGLNAVRAEAIEPGFLRWVLEASEQRLRSEANGSTFEAITAWNIGEVPYVDCSRSTQRTIADFLDRETAEIDAMLAALDELTRNLKQRSGIVVANELKSHYLHGTIPLAFSSGADNFFDGDWVESKDQDPDGDIRLLQLADIGDGTFLDKSNRRINQEAFERLRCREVQEGDILIARMPHPLGRACILPTGLGRTITVVDVAVLRPDPNRVIPKYLVYVLNSISFRAQLDSLQSGSTRQRISRSRLGQQRIPMPPVALQRAAVSHLDEVTGRINAMLAKIDELKALLVERRAALITDVVTGRKKVPA